VGVGNFGKVGVGKLWKLGVRVVVGHIISDCAILLLHIEAYRMRMWCRSATMVLF